MKARLTALTALLCLSTVWAGNDAGNGGHGLVCSDGQHEIASIQFFDLWYARKELQLKLITSEKDAKTIAHDVVLRLYQADRKYFEGLLVSYAGVAAAQVKLEDELDLIPPKTFLGNIVPSVDSGCQIEPLAVYADSGVLLTKGKYWNALKDSLHIAAFYVHESLGEMLRKRELEKLREGDTLSEEMRKRIARDTVNITSIAFTDLSDKQFLRKLQRYWTSGEVFEKTKLQKIISEYRIFTEPGKHSDKLWDEAMEKCDTWKKEELRRIEPLSEFALIECGKQGSQRVHGDLYQGYAIATITAVPKQAVLEFTDNVRSQFVPFGEPDEGVKIYSTWKERVEKWRSANEARFGNRLYLQHEGSGLMRKHVARTWKWQLHFAGDWKSGIEGLDPNPHSWAYRSYDLEREVGDFSWSSGKVYLMVPSTNLKDEVEKTLTWGGFGFHSPENETTERQAAKLSLDHYERECEKWLDKKYSDGAVFATCAEKSPYDGEKGTRLTYEVNARLSRSYFSSRGRSYFQDE